MFTEALLLRIFSIADDDDDEKSYQVPSISLCVLDDGGGI